MNYLGAATSVSRCPRNSRVGCPLNFTVIILNFDPFLNKEKRPLLKPTTFARKILFRLCAMYDIKRYFSFVSLEEKLCGNQRKVVSFFLVCRRWNERYVPKAFTNVGRLPKCTLDNTTRQMAATELNVRICVPVWKVGVTCDLPHPWTLPYPQELVQT